MREAWKNFKIFFFTVWTWPNRPVAAKILSGFQFEGKNDVWISQVRRVKKLFIFQFFCLRHTYNNFFTAKANFKSWSCKNNAIFKQVVSKGHWLFMRDIFSLKSIQPSRHIWRSYPLLVQKVTNCDILLSCLQVNCDRILFFVCVQRWRCFTQKIRFTFKIGFVCFSFHWV